MNLIHHLPFIFLLGVFGWDDIAMLFVKAAASAAAAKGVDALTPKTGMTTPGQTPQDTGMDLNALVSQAQAHQSELPKLQLQNRLPRQTPY